MTRKLKVYGWTAIISEAIRELTGSDPWVRQGRAIVAASSLAEVGRLLGRPHRQLFNLCETGNPVEVAVALTTPRTFFVARLDGGAKGFGSYQQVDPKEIA